MSNKVNILIPMAGTTKFFPEDEFPYPKPLIEIGGKMMIQHVMNNLNRIPGEINVIFIVNQHDCKKYHLDSVLKIMVPDNCTIIRIDKETRGAACSALLAIDYINEETPLVIANMDQIFTVSLERVMSELKKYDGGVITFDSVHPRWSYARVDANNEILETTEKRPISNHAIAGFYYFRSGIDFVNATMMMIKKDASIEGVFYIAPTFNEMVLANKKLIAVEIERDQYHTFYTPNKIKEYLNKVESSGSK